MSALAYFLIGAAIPPITIGLWEWARNWGRPDPFTAEELLRLNELLNK